MERLSKPKPSGLNTGSLRTWGMLFLAAGLLGQSILQNRLLGIGTLTGQQLLDALSGSQETMIIATAALVMQAVETCAVPVFAFLLVEGFVHTRDFMKYLLRVAGVAILSEIPYNLAMSGKVLELTSRNPVFALAIGLILLYFCRRYSEKTLQNTLIKLMVLVAAVLWSMMLNIGHGVALVLMTGILWLLRNKAQLRILAGAVAAVVLSILSPFYLASPMAFLPIYLYNGEQGTENRLVNYLSYPVILLVIGLIAVFCF